MKDTNKEIFAKKVQKRDCPDPGLNRGPSDLQSDALPTELSRQVEAARLNSYRKMFMALK